MHALARERVEVSRQRCDKRLALTCAHLGDASLVQDDSADELHEKVTHIEHSCGCLANGGKRVGHELVKRLARGKALLERRSYCL